MPSPQRLRCARFCPRLPSALLSFEPAPLPPPQPQPLTSPSLVSPNPTPAHCSPPQSPQDPTLPYLLPCLPCPPPRTAAQSMRRFSASNATAASRSSSPVLSCSMADDHPPSSPLRSANCAMPLSSTSLSDLAPLPSPPADAPLDADRKKAERARQRKHNLDLKAARSREYEERWREKCAQDMSEDSWASGWKQPLVTEEYGGWDYAPAPTAAAAADDHPPSSPLRSANCAMPLSSTSLSDPAPLPSPPADAPLDADRKKAERALQRKHNLDLKAARSREYEERWREKCAQDMSEDSWASGWKQPLVTEEYGGWDYAPAPAAAAAAAETSLGMHQYPSWKRKLHSEQLDRNYGGWDQPLPSSSEDTPLGGWLYPDPSEPLDDYQTEVEILGKKVMVTVASKGATVERWLEGRKEAATWGLDIEWRPTFQKGDYHYAALLQLSLEECCLLIQLQFIDTLPESLKRLLADPNIMMGGVGILADTNKLKNDYELICAGEVELTTLAVSTLKNTSLKKSGIAALAEKVLGVPYKKNKRATMSNWEIRDLTYAQIQYAAADAWLSYSILMALLNHKEVPAAPPPTLNSDSISSGNMTQAGDKSGAR